MKPPIALQLYTLRDALANDFAATIRQVAAMGYAGVEPAGFAGSTPQAAAQLFRELGLTVCAAHSPLPLGADEKPVIEAAQLLQSPRLVCAWQPPELFQSLDGIKRVSDMLNAASVVAQAAGISLGYHNHWFEYASLGGRLAADILCENLDDAVFLELDVYWIKAAGQDPAAIVRQQGKRAPLLHIKDGPAIQAEPMTAAGTGVMDFSAIAAAANAEWWIVELDSCATDMLQAVQQSYTYLTTNGLAYGKN